MRKILIVGGVAGGASAAARLRRLNEEDQIIMFEKDEYISFANCGLPYYIGDVITDRDKLLVQTVEGMSARFNLDIRNWSEVTKINKETKEVTVYNHKTKETYTENYDVLILSPGATPFVPPFPGLNEAKNIYTLRNLEDTDKIKEIVDRKPKHVTVIGGGFIGVEMAENIADLGISTTLVERNQTIMSAPFDTEMAAVLQTELMANGVDLLTDTEVSAIEDEGKTLVFKNGQKIETEIIIMAIGVRPSTKLAVEAGLEIGEMGGIAVNEQLQTSDANIFAIGDAIEVKHLVSGKATYIPLAWPANRQGRIVADYINGKPIRYKGTLGSSVLKVFNCVAAATGLTETKARALGYNVETATVHRGNHAGYYPNSTNITLKLVFDPQTGQIFGAQGIGGEGTEKRIDVIATAIIADLHVEDLETLELCYAPPFGSAKDPVNILGYVANNMMHSPVKMVSYDAIDEIVQNGHLLIDVRTEMEYELGYIEGSKNIPIDSLRNELSQLPSDKNTPIYITCQVGQRGHLATQILKNHGYTNLYNLAGGYKTYISYKDGSDTNKQGGVQAVMTENSTNYVIKKEVDAKGLQCPGPILETYKAINEVLDGEIVAIESADFGYFNDVKSWCDKTGNTLLDVSYKNNTVRAIVQKGNKTVQAVEKNDNAEKATIVLFSGEYDKTMAAMIIALGAASMGQEVSVFCTFWGLNALKKDHFKEKLDKSAIEKMFGAMLPDSVGKMPLSKMNMAGMGKSMMLKVMKDKNVDSVESLMEQARAVGVKFIACTMSMDVMGIQKAELRDDVVYGGVASYVADSQGAGLTLFI